MKKKEHCVTVVVDPRLGIRLLDLLSEDAIWIVDSPDNTSVVQAIWKEKASGTATELTSFKVDAKGTPEEWLVAELASIHLHHGEFSHDPAWSVLNAIGVSWSDRISLELAKFGFSRHADTPLGFVARRNSPQPAHTTA
jgi:hypothetical protein